MQLEAEDRRARQAGDERGPSGTTVGSSEDTDVIGDIERIGSARVNDDVIGRRVGKIAGDVRPARTAIDRFVDVSEAVTARAESAGVLVESRESDVGRLASGV